MSVKLAKGTKFYWGDGGAGAVKASKVHGTSTAQLTFTAKTAGTAGNSITVAIVNPGGTAALSIGVVGSAITINAAVTTGSITSTANDVCSALYQNASAAALIDVATNTTGLGVVTALTAAPLTGGTDSAEVFADIPGVGDISLDPGSYSRMEITSHSSTGPQPEMINEAFTSEGSLSFSLNWDEANAGHLALEADMAANTARNAKIAPPAGGGKTRLFTAQILSMSESYPVKGVVTRDVQVGIVSSIVKS